MIPNTLKQIYKYKPYFIGWQIEVGTISMKLVRVLIATQLPSRVSFKVSKYLFGYCSNKSKIYPTS